MKLFGNAEMQVGQEVTEYIHFQKGQYCVVDKFLDLQEFEGELKVLVP